MSFPLFLLDWLTKPLPTQERVSRILSQCTPEEAGQMATACLGVGLGEVAFSLTAAGVIPRPVRSWNWRKDMARYLAHLPLSLSRGLDIGMLWSCLHPALHDKMKNHPGYEPSRAALVSRWYQDLVWQGHTALSSDRFHPVSLSLRARPNQETPDQQKERWQYEDAVLAVVPEASVSWLCDAIPRDPDAPGRDCSDWNRAKSQGQVLRQDAWRRAQKRDHHCQSSGNGLLHWMHQEFGGVWPPGVQEELLLAAVKKGRLQEATWIWGSGVTDYSLRHVLEKTSSQEWSFLASLPGMATSRVQPNEPWLHQAMRHGHDASLQSFLSWGDDPLARDQQGRYAWELSPSFSLLGYGSRLIMMEDLQKALGAHRATWPAQSSLLPVFTRWLDVEAVDAILASGSATVTDLTRAMEELMKTGYNPATAVPLHRASVSRLANRLLDAGAPHDARHQRWATDILQPELLERLLSSGIPSPPKVPPRWRKQWTATVSALSRLSVGSLASQCLRLWEEACPGAIAPQVWSSAMRWPECVSTLSALNIRRAIAKDIPPSEPRRRL